MIVRTNSGIYEVDSIQIFEVGVINNQGKETGTICSVKAFRADKTYIVLCDGLSRDAAEQFITNAGYYYEQHKIVHVPQIKVPL